MAEHDQEGRGDEPESYSADYVMQLRQAADQRVLAAEMRGRALAAGMVDPEGLKLLDLSGVKLLDDGSVQIPDGFFDDARRAKPFLFVAKHTASVAKAPDVAPMRARNAVEMNFEEWQAARSDLLRRL
jgi:hypothetical protein